MGRPSSEFPAPWSINRWLSGSPLARTAIHDGTQLAIDLAEFLGALYQIDPTGGTPAGVETFYRGSSPAHYDSDTRLVIDTLSDELDSRLALEIWDHAVTSAWTGRDVWFHGDVAVGNLLVEHGRLSAVIDFGTSGVGDPACDTVIAWTYLTGEARKTFAAHLGVPRDCWVRGRGWALWKCLITLRNARESDESEAAEQRRILSEILSDPII